MSEDQRVKSFIAMSIKCMNVQDKKYPIYERFRNVENIVIKIDENVSEDMDIPITSPKLSLHALNKELFKKCENSIVCECLIPDTFTQIVLHSMKTKKFEILPDYYDIYIKNYYPLHY